MGKNRYSYPPGYRARMVELVRAGRTPEELSREFEPTAQSIQNWVKKANLDVEKTDSRAGSVKLSNQERI